MGTALSIKYSFRSGNQDGDPQRINVCNVRECAQGRTFATLFELADIGHVISQHLRYPLLGPTLGNSQSCQLNTKGLSKVFRLAFLDSADGFCHIGIIDRRRRFISGTIDP